MTGTQGLSVRYATGAPAVPPPARPRMRLTLLGCPALVGADGPLELSPSATILCAYLALAPPDGRSRRLAAAHLLADCSEPTARRRLNTALWRLRTQVRASTGLEIVASAGRSLALTPGLGLSVDATEFEQLLAPVLRERAEDLTDAHVASLEEAVALRRGPLVEGCDDDWVLAERYRVENLFLTALDLLLQHHGARGDVAAVWRYGECALEVEPLREDIHRHLMTAYGAAGRNDLVERQFERCRQTLLDQLGSDPMPETLAAYSRWCRGAPSEAPVGLAALVDELERARRDIDRLADSVDRALDRLRRLR